MAGATVANVTLAAAQTHDSLPGRVVERATGGPDTAQTFAVYYPSAYDPQRRWPLLFVMDPRGRAMLALRLFAPAAERHGFIVVSSYNTLSDGATEPNIGAVNAMLTAAQTSIPADMSRLYIAGFSGTARLGWSFELEAPKNFAGILSAGAAPLFLDTASIALLHEPGFAIALTTGTTDFNGSEVRKAEAWLRAQRVPARVETYEGPHSWPPAPLVERALAWFKLRGMLDGRWPMDSAWVRERVRGEAARADSLASAGQTYAAAEVYDQLDGLLGAKWRDAEIGTRARELSRSGAVVELRKRLAELDERDHERVAKGAMYFAELRREERSVTAEEVVRRLDLRALSKTAAQGDTLEKPWASRVLAFMQVSLGFYEPRAYLELKRPARALLMLEALTSIAPWTQGQCIMYSQAMALLPESDRASVASRLSSPSAHCGKS